MHPVRERPTLQLIAYHHAVIVALSSTGPASFVRRSIASRRSFADAQDDTKGTPFFVILNEGYRSEGSTRSDFSVDRPPLKEMSAKTALTFRAVRRAHRRPT